MALGSSFQRQREQAAANANPSPQSDGCREAVAFAASMPQRGRLDLKARSVVITQRLGGTMVLQRIAITRYAGVAAELLESHEATEGPAVKLVLRHEDAAYSVTLAEALPIDDAVAVWRQWADRLSAPLLLGDETGADSLVRDMIGAVVRRDVQPRRARTLAGRRPRYSKRRGRR
ncbi:MAG: DUF6101 family protein [Cohaesibacteraceae bacterium]